MKESSEESYMSEHRKLVALLKKMALKAIKQTKAPKAPTETKGSGVKKCINNKAGGCGFCGGV